MGNDKQRKTFLSYSRANKDFAIKLAKELKSEGFYVWLDQLDIPAGARWDREVEKALKECEIFMIILTPSSIDSENVLDEIGYAIDNRKRFLPVLLENCEVPLRLRRFQYVDFTNKSFDDGVESAKELLRSLIAQTTIPRTEVPADAQGQSAQAEREAQAEADRKAKEETERIAKRVADEELAAKVKVATKRKEKEESDRIAAQKTEAEQLAKQQAEEERLAQAKAETERKAKEEGDRLVAQKEKAKPVEAMPAEIKAEPVSAAPVQKKPISVGLVIAIVAVVVLVIAGVGYGILSNRTTTPPSIPIESFVGTWLNNDPNTSNWTKIEVTSKDGALFAHFWGACSPTDCDAGTASATYNGDPVQMSIDHGFATSSFTLSLNESSNNLHVKTFTHFTDNSGREDMTLEDDFHK